MNISSSFCLDWLVPVFAISPAFLGVEGKVTWNFGWTRIFTPACLLSGIPLKVLKSSSKSSYFKQRGVIWYPHIASLLNMFCLLDSRFDPRVIWRAFAKVRRHCRLKQNLEQQEPYTSLFLWYEFRDRVDLLGYHVSFAFRIGVRCLWKGLYNE